MAAFASAPLRRDYVLVAGGSFFRQWRIKDRVSGDPVDLTGATVDWHIRTALDAVAIEVNLSAFVSVTDGPNGEITMDAPPSATLGKTPAVLFYDMRLTRGTVIDYLIQGEFNLLQPVTRT